MILKTNLHFHTKDDSEDNLPYSFHEGIDCAANLGFEVIAHTCHNKVVNKPEYTNYAAEKNVLLIAGIEKDIEECHVVILNPTKEAENLRSFADLYDYKKANSQIFVLAPHPFHIISSLGKKLREFSYLFDAVEYSWFYTKLLNPNKKAVKVARKYNLPLIATSDTHWLETLDKSYALIKSEEKTPEAILKAVKNGQFSNVTSPIGFFQEFIPRVAQILLKK